MIGQDIFITKENNLTHYNKLTSKRKAFINQLYNLINTQFEEQKKLEKLEPAKIIEELENNSDYIQRIFIDAPWGMGKSFFSKALQEKVEEERITRIEFGKKEINFININAWETDYFSDPMKSLIGEINNSSCELTDDAKEKAEKLLSRGFQALKKIGLNRGLSFIMEAGLDRVLCKIGFDEAKRKEFMDIFNETEEINTNELEEYIKYKNLVTNFKISLSKDEKLKVIVIDELDRCKPTYAIELLETVKHFFGVKNIIFIFLVNKEQLKSIASTSYLTEDKCSEYFEKFFDIQFNLPELEYKDFIQIEYDKYDQPQTYEVNNEGVSEDNIRIYESIFLEAFTSNCNSSFVSPRNFIKSFKKFRILLTSLSDEERACYPLMIVLILYFIKKEFLNNLINDTRINISIAELFFRTFFEYSNGEKFGNERFNLREIIHSYQGYKLKHKYIIASCYEIFLQVLYHETGEIRNIREIPHLLDYLTLGESINIYDDLRVWIELPNKKIIFNKIYLGIYPQNFMSDEFKNVGHIKIIKKSFSEKDLKKYSLTERGNSYYSTALLEAWAEEKYNFTMNIK